MGEGDLDADHTLLPRQLLRGATEAHARAPPFVTDHLDVAPRGTLPDAVSQGLEDRLLGGEAGGEVLLGAAVPFTVGELVLAEEALPRVRMTLEQPLDALDRDQIDADGDAACERRAQSSVSSGSSSSVSARARL